jgi:hypothetical protein
VVPPEFCKRGRISLSLSVVAIVEYSQIGDSSREKLTNRGEVPVRVEKICICAIVSGITAHRREADGAIC